MAQCRDERTGAVKVRTLPGCDALRAPTVYTPRSPFVEETDRGGGQHAVGHHDARGRALHLVVQCANVGFERVAEGEAGDEHLPNGKAQTREKQTG